MLLNASNPLGPTHSAVRPRCADSATGAGESLLRFEFPSGAVIACGTSDSGDSYIGNPISASVIAEAMREMVTYEDPHVICLADLPEPAQSELAERMVLVRSHRYTEHPTYTGPDCAICGLPVGDHASAVVGGGR